MDATTIEALKNIAAKNSSMVINLEFDAFKEITGVVYGITWPKKCTNVDNLGSHDFDITADGLDARQKADLSYRFSVKDYHSSYSLWLMLSDLASMGIIVPGDYTMYIY